MLPLRAPWGPELPTFAWSPEPVHAVPEQHSPGQLCEGLCDVEVTQRADFEEGDPKALGVGLGLLCGYLPLEGQVQAVAHQDFRDARGMLKGQREAREVGALRGSAPLHLTHPAPLVSSCGIGTFAVVVD